MQGSGDKIGQNGKFAKFSCRENFMFYSTLTHQIPTNQWWARTWVWKLGLLPATICQIVLLCLLLPGPRATCCSFHWLIQCLDIFVEGVNVKPGTRVTSCFAEPNTNQVALSLDSGEQVLFHVTFLRPIFPKASEYYVISLQTANLWFCRIRKRTSFSCFVTVPPKPKATKQPGQACDPFPPPPHCYCPRSTGSNITV